jgi:hypothetical protein
MSRVKAYLTRQLEKIQLGTDRVLLQDYIFSKEVKIGHYRGSPPPGAEVAMAAMLKDPMAEPPYKWRVPYVIGKFQRTIWYLPPYLRLVYSLRDQVVKAYGFGSLPI